MGLFDFMRPDFENRKGYSPERDKPETRQELAKLVLKDHFFDLIPFNLLLLLLSLPLLFWLVTGANYIRHAMGTTGTLADFISLSRTWVFIMFPCIAFTGPFLSAFYLIFRNIARDDFRLPKYVFLQALRQNWKPSLAVSCITAALPVLFWANLAFYGPEIASGNTLLLAPLLLVTVLCLLWIMALPTLHIMIGTYDLSLGDQIKNTLALMLSHLPLSVGVELLANLPLFITALAFLIGGKLMTGIVFIACAYYLLFGFAVTRVLYAFLTNYLCETFLNPQIAGAEKDIGLRSQNT